MDLTPAQNKILSFIQRHVRETGLTPTVREIGHRSGLAIGTVQDHLVNLERKGVLRRLKERARGLVLTSPPEPRASGLPVLGAVPAGSPREAIASSEDRLALPPEVAGKADFVLRAKGDSMAPRIEDGDWLCVRLQSDAVDGDIVIAQLDEATESTVKRFRRRDKKVYLEADNPKYAPILRPFVVVGKVTALFRSRL